MLARVLFCIFVFIVLFDASFVTSQYNSFPNLTMEKLLALSDKEGNIPMEKLVSTLKALLTDSQKLHLIDTLLPKGFKLVHDKSEDSEVNAAEMKRIYEDTIIKNLTKVSMYELLDVPELLSNATRLRRIRNNICSPRPIRPKKHIKSRNPSNIPGASSYVVYERTVGVNVNEQLVQFNNRSLSVCED